MKILIACEFSGIVRNAFIDQGHNAVSCDLLPTEKPGKHYIGDVRNIINNKNKWDMMIAHPPCTYLACSGARWFKKRLTEQKEAINFFMDLVYADIKHICIENPISIMSTIYRKPDQYIQPYEFGHPETKKTSLWLKGLSKLKPTNIVEPGYIIGKDGKRYSPIHYLYKGNKDRAKIRSRTYQGIADAMAKQWG